MATLTLPDRLSRIPVAAVLSVLALGIFSLLVLYSAAGGSWQPWAMNQGIRFTALFVMMLVLSQFDIGLWMKFAYLAYAACLVLLIGVEILGQMGGGSQRWLNLGVINLQPSELMKIAVVLALARYYHFLPRAEVKSFRALVLPAVLMGLPAALVMMQPDLGTALTIVMGGTVVIFLAGASIWLFIGGATAAVIGIPLAVNFLLKEYQQRRVLIFLDPEADPLGAGYHITQSKIAIGSGGIDGKGFLSGSQSHLQYLPEQQTDFIFATMTEEWGLIGGLFMLACYARHPGVGSGDRADREDRVRAADGAGPDDDAVLLHLHQSGDGHGLRAGRRHPPAPHELWRVGHADRAAPHRHPDVRARAERPHAPDERSGRLLEAPVANPRDVEQV